MSENGGKVGVAFSGGGIRAAALSSGVLRRLLQKKVHFDYLSCVSGGGYCGASYLEWKYHHNGQDNPKWHIHFFNNMRKHCGIICDWESILRGICDTIILFCLLLFVVVLVPVLNVSSPSLFIAFIVDYFVGDTLRQSFVCPDSETKSFDTSQALQHNLVLNLTVQNFLNHTKKIECVPIGGDGLFFAYKLFIALALGIVLLYIITTALEPRGIFYSKAKFLLFVFLFSLAFTFTPWLIEEYISVISTAATIGFLILATLVWVAIPFLRNKTFMVILIYVYSYVVKWRVYKTNVIGIEYHEHLFNVGLCVCAFLLWLNPYVCSLQRVAIQTYNRWKLQRAFFYPQHIGTCGCSGISLKDCFPTFALCDVDDKTGGNTALSFSDLRDIKPEYICNLLIGNWIKYPDNEECESYCLLTVTPYRVERIDCGPNENTFDKRLSPDDVKLSDMMAASAAAVSGNMGIYQNSMDAVRDIQVILGINMGKSIASEFRNTGISFLFIILVQCIIPLTIQFLIIAPVILLPIATTWNIEKWTNSLVASTLVIVSFLFFVGTQPTGKKEPGIGDKIIRWCVVNIQQVRFIREICNVVNYGPVPPPILTLSDGGHIENLGLLPLLKRRCERILVVNGGYWESDVTIARDLIVALDMARKWLRCSFSGQNGRDIVEDIKSKFVNKVRGIQPRVYSFKVEYFQITYGHEDDIKTGEGQIRILFPRHPLYGEKCDGTSSWEEHKQDTGLDIDVDLWGSCPHVEACDVDKLTFCCSQCCHCQLCYKCSILCCGLFPRHVTSNQFFTPEMFSQYHREGYRASLDGKVEHFLDTSENE